MKAATSPRERQEEPQQNGDSEPRGHVQLLAVERREVGRLGEELSLQPQSCEDSSDDSSTQVGAADTCSGPGPSD